MKLKKKKIKVKNKKYYNNFLIIVYMGKKHTFKRILKQRDNTESERDGTTTEEFAKLLNTDNHNNPNMMQQTFGMPAQNTLMQQTFGMSAPMQHGFEMPAHSSPPMQQTLGAHNFPPMQQTLGAHSLPPMQQSLAAHNFDQSMQQTLGAPAKNFDSSLMMAPQMNPMQQINGSQSFDIDKIMNNSVNNLAKLNNFTQGELPQMNNMIGGGSSGIHNLAKLNNKNFIKNTTNSGISNLAKLL
jgi:hypothetical protein